MKTQWHLCSLPAIACLCSSDVPKPRHYPCVLPGVSPRGLISYHPFYPRVNGREKSAPWCQCSGWLLSVCLDRVFPVSSSLYARELTQRCVMFPKQKASSSRGFRHWSVQSPDLHNVTGGSYVILPLLPGWLSGSVERQIKESVRGKSGHTVNPIASHRSVYRKWRERHCIVLTPQKKIWSLTGGRDGVPSKDWKQSMKMVLSWAGQACKEKQMLEEGNGNRAKPPWRIQGRTPMISFWASAFGCVSHTAKMSVWDFE